MTLATLVPTKQVQDNSGDQCPSTPRVSVGLPVYNGERYLERTLESLLAQDFEDFELIISDNASTDRTEEICRRFAARDPRVRYLRAEENRGGAWNFNRVFELARGEYFRWACHDDGYEPSHLRRCVETLDASPPSVALVYTRTIMINEDDEPVSYSDDQMDTRGLAPHQRLKVVAQRLRYSNVLYGLQRREALARTRLHGAYESSDYVLLVELCLLGEFAEIPEYLFRRRIHPAMSRQANKSAASIAHWFSAGRVRPARLAHLRLQREYAAAIARTPMDRGERIRTNLALRYWWRRGARPLAKEILAMVVPGYSVYR